jgi:hypothetical protein
MLSNHVVMHIDKDDSDMNLKELAEEWGPTITVVDFGYDHTGTLKSAMVIIRTGLKEIEIDPKWDLTGTRPPSLDDVLMYYTPDRETFPQCTHAPF